MHSTKKENLTSQNSPNVLEKWFLATRPKTWIASISPVCIGTALVDIHSISWTVFLLTLLFSLAIQIGTNFANDYFDFIHGADTDKRQGPKRAVQSGWISPNTMRKATVFLFGFAFLMAIPLMAIAGLWSIFVTIAAILFGILYTGGPKPLGYLGLGEVLVLIFFGPIATCGTYYLQTLSLNSFVCLASLSPGLFSCALIIANNLRDEETDRLANKKTLIVRFGKLFGCLEYAFSIGFAVLIPLILLIFYQGPYNLLSVFFLFPIAVSLIKKAFVFNHPKELIAVLQGTSLLFFFYTMLFCIAYARIGIV